MSIATERVVRYVIRLGSKGIGDSTLRKTIFAFVSTVPIEKGFVGAPLGRLIPRGRVHRDRLFTVGTRKWHPPPLYDRQPRTTGADLRRPSHRGDARECSRLTSDTPDHHRGREGTRIGYGFPAQLLSQKIHIQV